MKIDLLHNKIIIDTITESFVGSFMDSAVPMLEERYGVSLQGVQMYEDYLDCGFICEGEFYYPLTLVFEDGQKREWIKWSIAEKKKFENGIPYSYIGNETLDFKLVEDIPEEFEKKLTSREMYFEGGYIPLEIDSPALNKLFLVGKYSQSFIDEITRAVSREIEKFFSISGIADSTVKLTLAFSPETFMEHVVDGVTYRRLLISARGCSARDLWIKWTNKKSSSNLTVSDDVLSGEVEIELGEEVPNKVREKEYRYLVRTSAEKYQSAMGRKNITEWRDLIKRVIKRGEVEKLEVVKIDSQKSSELAFKLQEVLGFSSPAEPAFEKAKAEDNSDLAVLLKGVLGVADEAEDEETVEEEAVTAAVDKIAVEKEQPIEIEEPISEEALVSEIAVAEESVEETSYEDDLRKKIESEIRVKLAEEARIKAEEETAALRRAHEELRAENERLAEAARKAEEERLAIEASKAEEAERLRIEIESRERAEAREKERMAEAARLALIEEQRLMAARLEEERIRQEKERQAEEERRLAEERARIEEQRRLEEERIRLDMEARAREAERAKAAEAERLAATKKAEESRKPQPTYTYVSKVAKLLFKYPIDPNITKRIHEIILSTIKYFHKEDVYIKIKASMPDSTTVHLHFEKIPAEENELLINIIKVLGKSDLGITKVYLE
ncbi:MAG: hypothetical protein E7612_09010 [Ruminococcaceae bacterium]|nr:hypothetical protein [Oscillospiraceae bacterium]